MVSIVSGHHSLEERIRANLAHVRARMDASARASGRRAEDVILVAVTKTVRPEAIAIAHRLGVRHCGENRIQELAAKVGHLPATISWHLVGHLQTNKVKTAVQLCDTIHSVDSIRVALAIGRYATQMGKRMPILLEVNVSGEASKFGLREDEVHGVVEQVLRLTGIDLVGLMTVAPLAADPELARPIFRGLRRLRDELRAEFPALPLPHLSMGMSDDFVVAIEEGATMVRVGRAIFGERPT